VVGSSPTSSTTQSRKTGEIPLPPGPVLGDKMQELSAAE